MKIKFLFLSLLFLSPVCHAESPWERIKNSILGPEILPGEPTRPAPTTQLQQCLNLKDLEDLPQSDLDDRNLKILPVTKLLVLKDDNSLLLLNGHKILRKYPVAFGFNTLGHKFREGDGRTPEGLYQIDLKNPESAFHLSLHISYPNKADTKRSLLAGFKPGGSIMIHGFPNAPDKWSKVDKIHPTFNWTDGCIAVTDQQIEEVYRFTKEATAIEICPRSE